MKQQQIDRYMAEYRIPAKTPVLTWTRKTPLKDFPGEPGPDGLVRYFWNCTTCAMGTSLEDVAEGDCALVPAGKYGDLSGYYIEYAEELDMVVLGRAELNTRMVTLENRLTPRAWQRCEEILIDRDRVARHPGMGGRDYFYGTRPEFSYVPQKYLRCGCFRIIDMQRLEAGTETFNGSSGFGVNGDTYSSFSKPLTRLFPAVVSVGANRFGDITKDALHFREFLAHREPAKKRGGKQAEIDRLTAIRLRDVEYNPGMPKKSAVIEGAGEGLCVLRTLYRDDASASVLDCGRAYVSKKDAVFCRPNTSGEWVGMPMSLSPVNWDFVLTDVEDGALKGTKLEYFAELVDEAPPERKGRLICAMLANPLVEQLAKAGGRDVALREATESNNKPSELFGWIFGKACPGKRLTEKLGVNRHQMEAALEAARAETPGICYEYYAPVFHLKKIFEDDGPGASSPVSIAWMDDGTFDMLAGCLERVRDLTKRGDFQVYDSFRRFDSLLRSIRQMYGLRTMTRMAPKVADLFATPGITGARSRSRAGEPLFVPRMNCVSAYSDYLDLARDIKTFSGRLLPCDFDPGDPQGIFEMHDAAVDLYNAHANEAANARMGKALEASRKWEYEGSPDDGFLIRTPSVAADLISEGLKLHHCVGGYVDRVASRATNILFLRRKEAPDEPFFTIEVSNGGIVRQIHGMCNTNLVPDSPEEKFVRKWVREKRLKAGDWNRIM